jgi:hypothetical protein
VFEEQIPETVGYERRALFYFDILGWSELVRQSATRPDKLYDIERALVACSDLADSLPVGDVLCVGQFSDHFVISALPTPQGLGVIRDVTMIAVRTLLLDGHCVRGALVVGDLVHRRNRIYGPALLDAVYIESRVAKYPRVVFSDAAVRLADELDGQTFSIVGKPSGEILRMNSRVPRRKDADGLTYLDVIGQFNGVGLSRIQRHFAAQIESLDESNLDVRAKLQWLVNEIAASPTR